MDMLEFTLEIFTFNVDRKEKHANVAEYTVTLPENMPNMGRVISDLYDLTADRAFQWETYFNFKPDAKLTIRYSVSVRPKFDRGRKEHPAEESPVNDVDDPDFPDPQNGLDVVDCILNDRDYTA